MSTRDVRKLASEQGPYTAGEKGVFVEVFTVASGTVDETAANTTEEEDFTVAGLDTGDVILSVQKPSHQAGLGIVNARVSAANTLSITYMNTTASGIVPASEDYKVAVLRINK